MAVTWSPFSLGKGSRDFQLLSLGFVQLVGAAMKTLIVPHRVILGDKMGKKNCGAIYAVEQASFPGLVLLCGRAVVTAPIAWKPKKGRKQSHRESLFLPLSTPSWQHYIRSTRKAENITHTEISQRKCVLLGRCD